MTNLRLNNPSSVRRLLARIVRMTLDKEIDTKTANTVIIGCNAILSSMRLDEQQKKIDELERLINERLQR